MTLSAEEARAFIKRRTDAPKTVHLKVPEGSIDSSNTDGALETLANARRAGG